MPSFMKTVKKTMILVGILTTILGIAIMANPTGAADFFVLLIGWTLVFAAVATGYGAYGMKKAGANPTLGYIFTFIEALVGISIVLNSGYFVGFLTYIFAALLMFHGFNDIIQGVRLKSVGYEKYGYPIGFGVISVLLSVVILINPLGSIYALMLLIGASLVVDGISDVIVGFMMRGSDSEE